MAATSPHFDAEHRLVAACALVPAALQPPGFLANVAAQVRSWEKVVVIAGANQLRPETARWMSRHVPAAPESEAARVSLATAASAFAGQGRMLTAELANVLDALRDAGVRVVPFKGPAFCNWLGDAPGLREMGDLDLLIDPADIGRAVTALAALGFDSRLSPQALRSPWLHRCTIELPLTRADDRMLVELHWRLTPGWHPPTISTGDVLASATQRPFYGTSMLWPAPESLLLIHVADALKSCGNGLRWVADLARIIRNATIDWDHVRTLAGSRGGATSLRVALAVVDRVAAEVDRATGEPVRALELPPPARVLVREADGDARAREAIRGLLARLSVDARATRPAEHFRWAMEVADRPAGVALEVLRYLSGPAIADVAAIPPGGESGASLHYRALRRRLGGAVAREGS